MNTSKRNGLDKAIVSAYPEFGVPADRILADPQLGQRFTELVSNISGSPVQLTDVNWRLLTLRKRGEDNGGLPRLERRYWGRN